MVCPTESGQLAEGPAGVGGDDGVGGGGQFFQGSAVLGKARVSHSDGDVAQETAVAGARDGCAAEKVSEFGLAERSQLFERRREFAGVKGGGGANGGAAFPGADVLADVAAEDVRTDGGATLQGDGGAELDGEVRDAERGIDTGWHDGGGGTGVDAAAAGAAAGGGRGIGRDIERDEQFAEEEPGAAPLVDEAGVFADPAERGEAGVGALQQRRGIHADSGFEWTGAAAEERVELP